MDEQGEKAPVKGKPAAPSPTEAAFRIESKVSFWRADDGTTYATYKIRDSWQTWPVESPQFESFVRDEHIKIRGGLATPTVFTMIMDHLRSRAAASAVKTAAVRVKRVGDTVYFNMCDDKWRCIKVTAEGWEMLYRIPPEVPLIRAQRSAPYPEPVRGGKLEELRDLMNVGEDEANWKLLCGFLLAAMRDAREYPVLVLSGQQGSAKTTISNMMIGLIDPANDSAGSIPEREEDLAVTARSRHILAFDNISKISAAMSDTICKVATGLTINKRRLYTDTGVNSYTVFRPVVLNGIPDLVDWDDMGRRMISVYLGQIPPDRRLSADQIMDRFNRAAGRIFGGLLDALVVALRNEKVTIVDNVDGLIGVAQWVESAAPALNWKRGCFIDTYNENRENTAGSILDGDSFAQFLEDFIEHQPGKKFQGTFEEFKRKTYGIRSDYNTMPWWPKDAKRMIDKLRRIAPALARHGFEFYGLTAQNGRVWRTPDSKRLRVFEIRKVENIDQRAVSKHPSVLAHVNPGVEEVDSPNGQVGSNAVGKGATVGGQG